MGEEAHFNFDLRNLQFAKSFMRWLKMNVILMLSGKKCIKNIYHKLKMQLSHLFYSTKFSLFTLKIYD